MATVTVRSMVPFLLTLFVEVTQKLWQEKKNPQLQDLNKDRFDRIWWFPDRARAQRRRTVKEHLLATFHQRIIENG